MYGGTNPNYAAYNYQGNVQNGQPTISNGTTAHISQKAAAKVTFMESQSSSHDEPFFNQLQENISEIQRLGGAGGSAAPLYDDEYTMILPNNSPRQGGQNNNYQGGMLSPRDASLIQNIGGQISNEQANNPLRCVICSKDTTFHCPCGPQHSYCSQEHQVLHWEQGHWMAYPHQTNKDQQVNNSNSNTQRQSLQTTQQQQQQQQLISANQSALNLEQDLQSPDYPPPHQSSAKQSPLKIKFAENSNSKQHETRQTAQNTQTHKSRNQVLPVSIMTSSVAGTTRNPATTSTIQANNEIIGDEDFTSLGHGSNTNPN